jgi:hypothetical protein
MQSSSQPEKPYKPLEMIHTDVWVRTWTVNAEQTTALGIFEKEIMYKKDILTRKRRRTVENQKRKVMKDILQKKDTVKFIKSLRLIVWSC